MTTPDVEDVRTLRDELVRAQAAARIARRRVDELEAAVAQGADAVAERDLIRDRLVDVEALTAQAETLTARAETLTARAETAERTLAMIYASRVWRTTRVYERVVRRLPRP